MDTVQDLIPAGLFIYTRADSWVDTASFWRAVSSFAPATYPAIYAVVVMAGRTLFCVDVSELFTWFTRLRPCYLPPPVDSAPTCSGWCDPYTFYRTVS